MEKQMRRYIFAIMIFTVACFLATDLLAQSNNVFEKLKALEGDWKDMRDGHPVEINYKVMSGGSAMVETLMPKGEPNMVTVYHLDGDKLMMTHYCSAGNQPRMLADVSSGEADELNFEFIEATNLKSSTEGYMVGLKIVFDDRDHFKQVWTWSQDGKEMPSNFEFERVIAQN